MDYFNSKLNDDQNNRENIYGDSTEHEVKAQWIANQLVYMTSENLNQIEVIVKGFIYSENRLNIENRQNFY